MNYRESVDYSYKDNYVYLVNIFPPSILKEDAHSNGIIRPSVEEMESQLCGR